MGRIKVCRVCKEVLYCKACGERQTPETPDWERVLIQLTPEQKEKASSEAKEQGISLNEYVRNLVEGGEDAECTNET